MQKRRKRWLLSGAIVILLLVITVCIWNQPLSSPEAVTITFGGFTNLPGNSTRFAFFTVSNGAPYSIRRRDDWSEIEGDPQHHAQILNLNLPRTGTLEPILKSGDSFIAAIGEPIQGNETGRWRFSMAYVPDTLRQRWLAFSFRHNLPQRIGPLVLVDDQKLLNPSNNIIIGSQWLTK